MNIEDYRQEPDDFDIDLEAEPPEDALPDQNIPADWVEGYDDNTASERGSHWEDE